MKLDAKLKKRLDALARQLTFERDRNKCVRCGKRAGLQWCHVRSRRYLSTRWRGENLMTLCSGCHLWWHHEPIEAVMWWRTLYPKRAEVLRVLAHTTTKTDYAALLLRLESGEL
jgi:5-methylcytosine-specific restriction endonuclease McrA